MVLLRGSKLGSLLALAGNCSSYSRTILVLSFLMRLSLFLSIQIVQLIIPPENVSMPFVAAGGGSGFVLRRATATIDDSFDCASIQKKDR